MKLETENGRSMVEMLGVLAIIGVLSIGGIVGYTLAMSHYKADSAAKDASMAYIEMQSAHGDINKSFLSDSFVEFAEVDGKADAGLVVNFKNDKRAAEKFKELMAGNKGFAISTSYGNE